MFISINYCYKILYTISLTFRSGSATAGIVEKSFLVPFETSSNSLKLVDFVDGLLLLTDSNVRDDFKDLYLWNPSLSKHRIVRPNVSPFEEYILDTDNRHLILGFGFNKGKWIIGLLGLFMYLIV